MQFLKYSQNDPIFEKNLPYSDDKMASQPSKNGPALQKRTKKLPKRFENFQMDAHKNGKKGQNNKKESSKKIQAKVALHNVTLKSILKQGSTPPPSSRIFPDYQ